MNRLLPRKLPENLDALTSLALDLRWTWSHAGDTFWRTVDTATWEQTQNPWSLLQAIPQRRLEELARDSEFCSKLSERAKERREYMTGPSWFTTNGARLKNERIAYFSMEFGLGEAIPLYAGGLGILAGDYLKTASDLALPLVGIGILFQEGYFRQAIDAAGHQRESYPYNDPNTLPIQPVAAKDGDWLRVPIELPGRTLWLRIWRANVGRVDLYLLDSNEPLNAAVDRAITGKLYGGDKEERLLQEIVLGIGGWRALHALGLEPSVAHLNEGHAAFVVLERSRRFMERHGVSFREALWATRAGNIFTTHTPVAAGFDVFPPTLVGKYFPPFGYPGKLGISSRDLLALGRRNADDVNELFNMAYLAMRGCARSNGVSRLHGSVSRRLFVDLFPRWPEREVPVDYVTNGVHVPTWDSRGADAIWTRSCGKERWSGSIERLRSVIATISDDELWKMRNEERAALISYARERLTRQLVQRGAEPGIAATTAHVLDPAVLTLGFARRFAEYKRPQLLLRDPDRLIRLLNNSARPVQIVIAGKAHPADEAGRRMVTDWITFVNRADVRHRAVFIEDYDITLATRLVAGIDVWINTPRRPWEACGTSGMKVLANGGLNLSELDGWWAEAYTSEVGWALGAGAGAPDDARDAEDLYALLEQQVAPAFYERDGRGVPRRWLARIRASLAQLAPTFSSNRMALEYAERFYADAGEALRLRARNGAEIARDLCTWESTLAAQWSDVRVDAKTATGREAATEFLAEVHLGVIEPEMVRVELFAEPLGDEEPFRQTMQEVVREGTSFERLFATTVVTKRDVRDFTPRIVPAHSDVRIPAECSLIAWASEGFSSVRESE